MSGPAMKYRVRLAFDGFQVGNEFISPPMSRAYAQVLQQKGLLEIVPMSNVNSLGIPITPGRNAVTGSLGISTAKPNKKRK